MERLTTRTSIMGRKHDIAYGCASVWKKKLKNDKYELIENVVDKLGQLEDIEEELGIDLVTLFKVLKQGYVFTTGFNNRLEKWFYQRIEGIDECYYPIGQKFLKVVFNQNKDFSGCRWIPSFKDYGKTWALTKEELL